MSGGIPKLDHNCSLAKLDYFLAVLQTHSAGNVVLETAVTKSVEEASFTHSWVANKNDLNQVLIGLIRSHDGYFIIKYINLSYAQAQRQRGQGLLVRVMPRRIWGRIGSGQSCEIRKYEPHSLRDFKHFNRHKNLPIV